MKLLETISTKDLRYLNERICDHMEDADVQVYVCRFGRNLRVSSFDLNRNVAWVSNGIELQKLDMMQDRTFHITR